MTTMAKNLSTPFKKQMMKLNVAVLICNTSTLEPEAGDTNLSLTLASQQDLVSKDWGAIFLSQGSHESWNWLNLLEAITCFTMQMQNLPVCIEACALWLGPDTSREEDHAKLLQNGSPSERGARAPEDNYSASKSWTTGTFSLLHM